MQKTSDINVVETRTLPSPAALLAELPKTEAQADFVVRARRDIHRLIATEKPLTPEARLEPGQPVRVRSGALVGLEGMVVKRKGEERLVIAVRFLNQGASIELEDVDLERI